MTPVIDRLGVWLHEDGNRCAELLAGDSAAWCVRLFEKLEVIGMGEADTVDEAIEDAFANMGAPK